MASRSYGWFDDAKLLPGERLIRSVAVRLRISAPPHWWEGTLTLTSDRLFFLPHIDHPDLVATAFWLSELIAYASEARDLTVATADQKATFRLSGQRRGPAALVGNQARSWLEAIDGRRRHARPRTAFQRDQRRRAAG